MWRDHLPYFSVKQVAKIGTTCFGATNYGLYEVDESEETVDRLNTISGLSDFEISTIAANTKNNTLIIAYKSGNVDLLKENKITNLNAILMSNVVGDKTIYAIHNEGDYAYLACGFGIVVLDLKKTEFKDTYYIGNNGDALKVNDITTSETKIYAATDEGVYYADKSTPFLSDFNAWSREETIVNFDDSFELIHYQNSKIFLTNQLSLFSDDTLYVFDELFSEVFRLDSDDFSGIEKKNSEVIIAKNYNLLTLDNSLTTTETLYTYGEATTMQCNHAIWDGENYWIGDRLFGLNKSKSNWITENFFIPGPLNNSCFQMSSGKEMVYVAAGLVTGSAWNNSYVSTGVFSFNQFDWRLHNSETETSILIDSAFDFIYTAVDPNNEKHALFCSFYGGLYEFLDNEVIQRYGSNNSAISTSMVHSGQVKISAAQFDKDGNIWAANSFTDKPLILITPDGNSLDFSVGSGGINQVITDLKVHHDYGQIWMTVRGQGVIVYDYNFTPEDPTDDTYKLLSDAEGLGSLPSTNVNCLTIDRDGEVWVGTEKGPAVFFNAGSIFQTGSNLDAQQILLLQDGSYQYLLETQSITGIAVDGANRKWFGTSTGGIFLMSEDGTEQIYSFNSDNSPLFSNNILSIAIVGSSGEVMIGTSKGIIGFRSTATEPVSTYSDVYCYPNPVRPGYNGPIAIKGLLENSSIKITDASGQLVNESISLGGQAVWYGDDLYGNQVSSGVYYVHLVSSNGQLKSISKVLIIR